MGSEDDEEYRRSVRNISALLVVVVIIVLAGLVLPSYFGAGTGAFPPPASRTAQTASRSESASTQLKRSRLRM